MFRLKKYSVAGLLVLVLGFTVNDTAAQQQQSLLDKLKKKSDSLQAAKSEVELINIGYTSINKKFVTSSISTLVNDNTIKGMVPLSANTMLQAQLPGVRSVSTSAISALTYIRGASSLNAGSIPLYIIDGIPVKVNRFANPLAKNVDNDPLSDLHPEDIASITVLKDGQATAIYGMRGANGVVLITTNGGTAGKTYLDISSYTGLMTEPELVSVLDTAQYRSFILAKERASGVSESDILKGVGRYLLLSTPANQVERYNNNTNWQDLVLKNGFVSNSHLTLRGGDAVAKYSLNVGYSKLNGVITNTDFNRFNVRFNLDYKVTKKLSFLNSLSFSNTHKKLSDAGGAPNTNQLFLTTLKAPTLTPFQQDLTGANLVYYDSADYNNHNNPNAISGRMINKNNSTRISGKTLGQYTLSPNLVLRMGVLFDYNRLDESRFIPSAGFVKTGYIIRSSSNQKSTELMFLNENTLTYSKKSKSGKGDLNAVIGSALQSTTLDSKYGRVVNSATDQQITVNTSDPLLLDSIGSISPAWKLASFFGTVSYAYNEKYIFGGNLRADGSSRFREKARWGYFPSASFAWRLSKEDFLKDAKFIKELKWRVSYGIAGNDNVGVINAFNSLVATPYIFSAVSIGILGNPNFQWESTKQFNTGIDLEAANGRLGLSVDFYNKKTDHLFNVINLPTTSGFSNYAVSEGAVRNRGIETALSWQILNNPKGLSWSTRFNFTYNKNTVLSMPSRMDTTFAYGDYSAVAQPGTSIGSFWGYNALGVYARTSDVNVKNGPDNLIPFKGGDVIFEDLNKDGIIDYHDQKVLGNVNPDVYGGFLNTLSYKHFDLSVFIDYAFGGKIYNARRATLQAMSNYSNQSTDVLRYWKNEGDQTDIPRLQNGDPVGNARFSSRWIEDGSYVRFKAVTLSYNFPLNKSLKGVFNSARLLITGQNLVTFSKYKGYSPEVGNFANPVMYGVDYGNVPPLRAVVVGVQLGL
ncbi:SusC/RagA family TonB-linked outer membrane protein [Ferruginibacter sp.]